MEGPFAISWNHFSKENCCALDGGRIMIYEFNIKYIGQLGDPTSGHGQTPCYAILETLTMG